MISQAYASYGLVFSLFQRNLVYRWLCRKPGPGFNRHIHGLSVTVAGAIVGFDGGASIVTFVGAPTIRETDGDWGGCSGSTTHSIATTGAVSIGTRLFRSVAGVLALRVPHAQLTWGPNFSKAPAAAVLSAHAFMLSRSHPTVRQPPFSHSV